MCVRSLARASAVVLTPLLLVIAGCGNVAANDCRDRSCPPSEGKEPTSTAPSTIEGSYDLAFVDVDESFEDPPAVLTPPSRGASLRIDLAKSGAGYRATVTPRWGRPATYAVAIDDASITLTGAATVTADSGVDVVTDEWTTLVLARDEGGVVAGDAIAEGSILYTRDGVTTTGVLRGTGRLAPDTTPPELRLGAGRSLAPAGLLFPWDPLRVEAAEPLTAEAIEATVTLSASRGVTLPLFWEPSPLTTPRTVFLAYAADFRAAGSDAFALATTGPATTDATGNAAPPLAERIQFVDLREGADAARAGGRPAIVLGQKDGPLAGTFRWGDTAIYGSRDAADPRCEKDACLRVGPVRVDGCRSNHAGIAGVLSRMPRSRATLRYRVLAHAKSGAPIALDEDLLAFEVAAPVASNDLERPAREHVRGEALALAKLDAPVDGMTYATAVQTFDIAAPSRDDVFGFAVRIGRDLPPSEACRDARYDVELLVEAIEAD